MKLFAGTFLVLLQVLISTLGQGALTLCVRRDGTQALEWTWASECQSLKSASHAACGHDACCEPDETDFTSTALRCDPCTDYLIFAEPMVVVDVKAPSTFDADSTPCWYMPIAVDGYTSCLTSLIACTPSFCLSPSLAPFSLSVVLRC